VKDVFALANSTGVRLDESKLSPAMLRDAAALQEAGKINADGFRQVLAHLYANGGEAGAAAKELDLVIEQNDDAVRAAIAKVLAESEKMVAEFKAGKTATRNAIFGKVMKELQRKGDPKAVGALLDEMLKA
jgi:aspartyl-tRNA(Asn)/glutamyl-tRNA(Gln) amidotransferase subunit B